MLSGDEKELLERLDKSILILKIDEADTREKQMHSTLSNMAEMLNRIHSDHTEIGKKIEKFRNQVNTLLTSDQYKELQKKVQAAVKK
jgi:hypothetical protein